MNGQFGTLNFIGSTMQSTKRFHLSRRAAIALVGGGAISAVTGLAGCSSTNPPSTIQGWQPAVEPDVRRFMLAHALLAPNPHNRQPWLADLRRDGEITLVCDGARLLPETDPSGRQILIGCGAFIELAVIAAAERGHVVQVEPFPAGEPLTSELPGGRPVARLLLRADPAPPRDALFAQITRRHTNKNVYDGTREIPQANWQALADSAAGLNVMTGAIAEPAQIGQIRAIMRESFATEMSTPRTWLETARLLRIGPSEIERSRDGIALMGTMPRISDSLGLFDRFEVPARGSSNFSRTMQRWAPQETGSGYVWIASRGNSRRSQIDTGRAYVRMHLQATAAGIDMHPQSQSLQEFAEVREQFDALHSLLGFDPTAVRIQMMSRIGYAATPAGPSPRRELNELVRMN
jgi:nitroreductase